MHAAIDPQTLGQATERTWIVTAADENVPLFGARKSLEDVAQPFRPEAMGQKDRHAVRPRYLMAYAQLGRKGLSIAIVKMPGVHAVIQTTKTIRDVGVHHPELVLDLAGDRDQRRLRRATENLSIEPKKDARRRSATRHHLLRAVPFDAVRQNLRQLRAEVVLGAVLEELVVELVEHPAPVAGLTVVERKALGAPEMALEAVLLSRVEIVPLDSPAQGVRVLEDSAVAAMQDMLVAWLTGVAAVPAFLEEDLLVSPMGVPVAVAHPLQGE